LRKTRERKKVEGCTLSNSFYFAERRVARMFTTHHS
jgi:hypothetical protein